MFIFINPFERHISYNIGYKKDFSFYVYFAINISNVLLTTHFDMWLWLIPWYYLRYVIAAWHDINIVLKFIIFYLIVATVILL